MATGNVVRIFLHFNWTTKYREPLITSEMEKIIRDVAFEQAAHLGCYVIAVDGTEDHRHLLIASPATVTASDIKKRVKGGSSHMINELGFQDTTGRAFRWQNKYAVFSVSDWAVNRVKKYIERQKKHHKSNTLIANLEVQEEDLELEDLEGEAGKETESPAVD